MTEPRAQYNIGNLAPRVLALLEQRAEAGLPPITAKAIAQALGVTGSDVGRTVRLATKQLRKDGHSIVATMDAHPGFALVTTREQVVQYLASMKRRIYANWDTYRDVERSFANRYNLPLDPTVFGNDKPSKLAVARAALQALPIVEPIPNSADPRIKFWGFVRLHKVNQYTAEHSLKDHNNDHAAALQALQNQIDQVEWQPA